MERVKLQQLLLDKGHRPEGAFSDSLAISQRKDEAAQHEEERNTTFPSEVKGWPDDVGQHNEHNEYKPKGM